MTVVVATHDGGVAARADRVVRLRDGAITDDVPVDSHDRARRADGPDQRAAAVCARSGRPVGAGSCSAQIRSDRPRTVTMLAAVAAATAAFTVLTGAADTSKVVADQKVAATGPSAYDILVRPRGTQTPIERASGEVRPGFLDGVFGGISIAHIGIRSRIPGVSVAAPVAMVGYTLQNVFLPLHIASVVGTECPAASLRLGDTTTDRGLSHIPSPPSYVYLTRKRAAASHRTRGTLAQLDQPVTRGRAGRPHRAAVCGGGQQATTPTPTTRRRATSTSASRSRSATL